MRSMQTMRTLLLTAVCAFNIGSFAATAAEAPGHGATPFAIPTFHCLGLYWSPPGGAADKEVLVRYRRQGFQRHPARLHAPRGGCDRRSFDYDLCNGRAGRSQEAHAVHGEPIYAAGTGFDPVTQTGRFQLAPDSPGVGVGQPICSFSRGYTGKTPDLGAHQRGAPPIQYLWRELQGRTGTFKIRE